MYCVMVTIIKLNTVRHSRQLHTIGPIQNCFIHPKGLTVSNKLLNLHLWSNNYSNETKKLHLRNGTVQL